MADLSPINKKRRRRGKMIAANASAYNGYHVPHDVVIEILSKLPLKSQIRFSCVCRLWFNSTHRLWFNSIHDHFLQYSRDMISHKLESLLNFWDADLVGYCNGLVCFHRVDCLVPEIMLYCPRLKGSRIRLSNWRGITKGLGFGFDPMTQEYKVVRIFLDHKSSSSMQCVVFIFNNETKEPNYGTKKPNYGTKELLWRMVTIEINDSWSLVPWGKPRTFEFAAIPWKEALCWRTENPREMVVFHLHKHKFQVIQQED